MEREEEEGEIEVKVEEEKMKGSNRRMLRGKGGEACRGEEEEKVGEISSQAATGEFRDIDL